MRVYGLKNCDTCRKAVKALEGAEMVDIRDNPLSRNDLSRLLELFGDALVNRKSTTWRGLSEAERAGDPLDLLIEHPALMKRPVIEANGVFHLGWGEEIRQVLL